MRGHRIAEERSIALHEAVAERLRADPRLVSRARERVEGWLAGGEIHPHYGAEWCSVLELPIDALCARLVDRSEEGRALRQCSPFAGVLDPPTRWRIWREAAARAKAS